MKCEPPRSPLGDVIFSDLYLFTASADTFKRKKKKSHPEWASVFKTNHSQWDSWEPKTQTQVRTHTCINAHIHTYAHSFTDEYPCEYRCR